MRSYKLEHALDTPERTLSHRDIIRHKRFLRGIYEDWYAHFTDEMPHLPKGSIIELGSGGGFLKELVPAVFCTDIIDVPTNDITFSALEMPLADQSISAIFMVDTMHHIPDCELFLKEVVRVLVSRGKMVMIEPANSFWGRFIYQNFHHEPFNPAGDWSIPSKGPLSDANGALPWIVLERDRTKFAQLYPELQIDRIEYIDPLGYLLSGGVSRAQFVPDWTYPIARFLDKWLPHLSKQLSMFMVATITRL
ncbi:class I SAM-dependent methyltransferase [bacterium]|nr:class I SAM-dependent methyltransferase [bacterium]